MIQRLATVGYTRVPNSEVSVIAVAAIDSVVIPTRRLSGGGNDNVSPLSVIVVSASSESHDGVGAAMTLSVIPFSSIPSVDCATSNGNSGIGDDIMFSWRACP